MRLDLGLWVECSAVSPQLLRDGAGILASGSLYPKYVPPRLVGKFKAARLVRHSCLRGFQPASQLRFTCRQQCPGGLGWASLSSARLEQLDS